MRPLVAQINLTHLKNNYLYLKALHGKKALAVIKADAYGHGAVNCALALDALADGFAVAFIEEALSLREAKVTAPILVLEGVFAASDYDLIDAYHLTPVIHSPRQLAWFKEKKTWRAPVTVWIKIDSGLYRSGFHPTEFTAVYHELAALAAVKKIVNMTHFSRSEELASHYTDHQFKIFQEATQNLDSEKSVSNSAAILYHPDLAQDYARIGISLYGLNPIARRFSHPHLKPVMTLKSEIVAERMLPKGESIGYGGIFTAPHDMRVGLVACGYADGYPRIPSQDNPVLIAGHKSRVLGRVSMDLLSVELNHPAQKIGSPVELWGENVSINEIALRAGTISYEILCHLKRAQKVFIAP